MAPTKEKALNPVQIIRNDLEMMTSQFAMVMPTETVDRFKRIVVTLLNEKPELQRCNPRSIIQCAMRAAQDGLDLDGREAAIMPFKNSDGDLIGQYVPLIFGIRKKVRQTGLVSDWNVQVVFEGDDFDFQLGDRPFIHHKPSLKGGRTRPIVAAYSIATFKDGTRSYEVMNIDEIEDVRTKSKAKHGPWHDKIFYPEMCRKTVGRLHSKQLPQSSDLAALFAREDADDALPPPTSAPPRLATITGTLDEFGGGASVAALSAPSDIDRPEPEGSESSATQPPLKTALAQHGSEFIHDDRLEVPDAPDVPDGPDAAAHVSDMPDPIEEAYERGKQQKTAGHSRKALPPEYRDEKHTREQIAWQAGYDGNPMPQWEHRQ